MTTHKNLMALSVAAVFALGLAACGSNGSDDPDPVTMDPDPMPTEPVDGGTITWEQLSGGYTAMPGESGTTYMLDLDTLPEGVDIHDVEGTHTFAAGATEDIAGVNFMCAAGSTGCTVEIDHDGHITIMGGNIVTAAATPPPPPEPTELELAQMAAMAAAAAAKTASDNAGMAADGAEAATMNLATRQTGEMAKMYAVDARTYAGMAMAEYMKAKKASDDAAAATDARTATMAEIAADAAKMAAEAAAMTAGEKAMKAEEAALMELMIDGTMKSVGDTTIDAMAGASSQSMGSGDDARTVVTGLIESMNPMATGDAITGNDRTDAVEDDLSTVTDETADAVPYKQAAAARTFAIGKTLDSSDDMARLMLVTDYAGTEMVKVFSAGDPGTTRTGTRPGYISIDSTSGVASTEAADANNTALRSVGTFYPVSGGTAGTLAATDSVAEDAKPVEVFSYTWTNDADPPVTTTVYATLMTTSTTDGTTTYTYNIEADIDAAVLQDGPDAGTDSDVGQVTSGIPAAVAYQHIHFGVWAGLGEAAKNGDQDIADLGIGFVQSIGDGMTGGDMPNNGEATYDGNWVAAVRGAHAAGAGSLSLENGDATLTAKFGDGEITADLDGLAELEGSIDGNAFSGTDATVGSNSHGLTSGGAFTGTFSGGFYGAEGAEAGGIFDFTSEGMRAGEFRGAFGGTKQEE